MFCFLAGLLLQLRMKRKKEVEEHWLKLEAIERKQINAEIDKKTYEELIQREIITIINDIFK